MIITSTYRPIYNLSYISNKDDQVDSAVRPGGLLPLLRHERRVCADQHGVPHRARAIILGHVLLFEIYHNIHVSISKLCVIVDELGGERGGGGGGGGV